MSERPASGQPALVSDQAASRLVPPGVDQAHVVAELARVKVLFQLRTIEAVIRGPHHATPSKDTPA